MTLQNRVQPTGDILAIPNRGTLMGNRGILHDDHQNLTQRRWQHPHWVTCVTKYKDWHRKVMQPRNYTELFFLDEPTALAAGHRPCGLCRHGDYTRFKALFNAANGTETLTQIDRLMQRDRITRSRAQVRYTAPAPDLPDGTFVLHQNEPHLLWQDYLLLYTPAGYTAALPRPAGQITVLTPACTVATLRQGYRPTPHTSVASHL
ncbi:MAG: hypothetical protein AAFN80_09555 [Pseudomonadota bacterium]